MTERWLPVPGFKGAYEVSDLGRVRSLDRIVESPTARRGYPKRVKGCVLRPQRHTAGYLHIGIGGRSRLIAHRVLEAFKGPRPPDFDACHNNGNKHDNALSNLRWDDKPGNCADKIAHGTDTAGERNGQAKLSAADVRQIRSSGFSRASLAEQYGVDAKHIDRIHRRERWTHV